jgi:hypothetical protein
VDEKQTKNIYKPELATVLVFLQKKAPLNAVPS